MDNIGGSLSLAKHNVDCKLGYISILFLRRTRVKKQFNFLYRYFSCFWQAGKLEVHRVINFSHLHGDKHKISNLVIILSRLSRYLKTA